MVIVQGQKQKVFNVSIKKFAVYNLVQMFGDKGDQIHFFRRISSKLPQWLGKSCFVKEEKSFCCEGQN